MSAPDIKYMKRALKLSLKGEGFVNPNPLVGAVIVKNGRIIGEGYHQQFGGPHAEINALKNCTENPEGATMYVTLEPCCHFGKTPPCCDALIAAKISKVVCALKDPNGTVAGKGFLKLQEAGIEVIFGVLENEAKKTNEIFIKYITTNQPFVLLKSAMTLDGKTAAVSGSSKWISSEKSRMYVQKLRHRFSSVMVGVNTVVKDDPELTARIKGGRNPLKVVIDGKLSIPMNAKILAGEKVVIFTSFNANEEKIKRLNGLGAKVIKLPNANGKISLKAVMIELGKQNIDSVLIEGGGILNSHALNEGVVDKLITFIAPKLIGGASAPTFFSGTGIEEIKDALKLKHTRIAKIGEDIIIESDFLN
ncbi:MAG: bifunctional diaminohydroxyphosphoribosylaminopyrimidine deaminase/5-amino-6-(5-phosphoribosylamino)uracil reductase RibD [Firmicutes bacterium]|nr:bifunctional diaminohydroxyphosphoribosylaminopyrimidine deaminase/5-amino-6-(5-phosphoribosylamino)uracil reductase RibD [Bacillota bacterium]